MLYRKEGGCVIEKVTTHKKQYLQLLLLGDEQESMIDQYLERGVLFVYRDDGVKGVCVVTDEGAGILEIKNLAIEPRYQRKGYGRKMICFVSTYYQSTHHTLRLGTGDSPLTVPFYEACGFKRAGCIPGFFVTHYDHPIYEAGHQLVDMIYFEKTLKE